VFRRSAHHGFDLGQNRKAALGSGDLVAAGHMSRHSARIDPSLVAFAGPSALLVAKCIRPLYGSHATRCYQESRSLCGIHIAERFRQLDDILSQPFFIGQAIWHFAPRRTMLAKCAADAALRYAEGLPHMIDAMKATERA
jgi:hypothetical protein